MKTFKYQSEKMELEESSPLLENKMTVSEIINNFGMGKFQWMLLFVIGLNAIGKKKRIQKNHKF